MIFYKWTPTRSLKMLASAGIYIKVLAVLEEVLWGMGISTFNPTLSCLQLLTAYITCVLEERGSALEYYVHPCLSYTANSFSCVFRPRTHKPFFPKPWRGRVSPSHCSHPFPLPSLCPSLHQDTWTGYTRTLTP